MASVRLTNDLRDKIRSKLRRAAAKYEETLGLNETDYSRINQWFKENVVQPEIERTQQFLQCMSEAMAAPLSSIIAEESERQKRLQRLVSYTTTTNATYGTRVKVRAKLPLEDGQTEEDRKNVVLELNNERQAPCFNTSAPMLDPEWGGRVVKATNRLQLDDHFPDIAEKLVEKHLFETRQRQHMKAINALLEDCNTMKQLFEAWPEAKALVPDWVHEKMRERTVSGPRTKKEIASVDDDVRKMTGLAISLNALDS